MLDLRLGFGLRSVLALESELKLRIVLELERHLGLGCGSIYAYSGV